MNNEWITDRLPTLDEWYVYDQNGGIVPCNIILKGEAWKPIPPCKPYVKPKRYVVGKDYLTGQYNVHNIQTRVDVAILPTREAAERIAAIYEEVTP